MALKKIEISDELLKELGVNKSPKELGEVVEHYVKVGINSINFSNENITLYNVILDLSKRLSKDKEANVLIKEALKDINLKLMQEF